jgi:hypothetical protein
VRIFVGSLAAALALAGAVYLHNRSTHTVAIQTGGDAYFGTDTYRYEHRKDGWRDPLAIFLAVAGVGAGAGIVFRR